MQSISYILCVTALRCDAGSAINAIRDEGQLALDKDKKLFRIGYEDRKSKVCTMVADGRYVLQAYICIGLLDTRRCLTR